jgi:hypothetical protein
MRPEQLLADLLRQGFRVVAHGGDIRVAPARRLTDALRQAIKKNKRELLALLRVDLPPDTQIPDSKAKTPPIDGGAAVPHRVEPTLHSPASHTSLVVKAPEPPASPEPTEPNPSQPSLCPGCRLRGYPNCPPCMLASDPGLILGEDGVIYRTRWLGTPWQTGPTGRPAR